MEIRRKSKKVGFFRSRLGIILLAFLFFFLLKATWGVFIKSHESSDKLKEAEREAVELSLRKNTLASEVAKLKTKRGVEEELRKTFQVGKPGEELAIILDRSSLSEENSEVKSMARWRWITNLWRR